MRATPWFLSWSKSATKYKVSLGLVSNETSIADAVAVSDVTTWLTPPKGAGTYVWIVVPVGVDGRYCIVLSGSMYGHC